MDDYEKKQYQLFEELEHKFKTDRNAAEIVEPVSDYASDNRMFLGGVSFVSLEMVKAIQNRISAILKKADEKQYYYLPESLHLTIQNIRTINYPPLFTEEEIGKVKKVFQRVIPRYKKMFFEVGGLFEMPTSLSIRAYCNDELQKLIIDLRENLIRAGVPDNKNYASKDIFFGNITICRYVTKPCVAFFDKIKELKNVNIGTLKIDKVSLITANAVAHPASTKIICDYYLN